jgi:hypothetical protein
MYMSVGGGEGQGTGRGLVRGGWMDGWMDGPIMRRGYVEDTSGKALLFAVGVFLKLRA